MGAVDLVIQVEAPPSVAAGCSASAAPGTRSARSRRACCSPSTAPTCIGLRASPSSGCSPGRSRRCACPRNPLDILAQHTVAACALEPLDVERLVRHRAAQRAVRRRCRAARSRRRWTCWPGGIPSDEFAELRPRLVYDRDAGTLTGRPGAQRLAVTSGGTIPDRGLFARLSWPARFRKAVAGRRTRRGDGLRVAGRRRDLARRHQLADHRDHPRPGAGHPRAGPARPAAVLAAATALGRPAELGEAVGAFTGELARHARARLRRALPRDRVSTTTRPTTCSQLLDEQRERHRHRAHRHHARGRAVPRRTRRLAGDPALARTGCGCTGRWALAVGARLRERYGIDEKPHGVATTASSCGCPTPTTTPPGAELFVFDADEIEPIVTAEVGGSALFAVAVPRVRGPRAAAAAAPPRASARRCGSSGSAPPSCSTSPASTRTSRSCWRRCASACRTSTTCRR